MIFESYDIVAFAETKTAKWYLCKTAFTKWCHWRRFVGNRDINVVLDVDLLALLNVCMYVRNDSYDHSLSEFDQCLQAVLQHIH